MLPSAKPLITVDVLLDISIMVLPFVPHVTSNVHLVKIMKFVKVVPESELPLHIVDAQKPTSKFLIKNHVPLVTLNVTVAVVLLLTVENVLISESTHQPVTVHIGPVTSKLLMNVLNVLANVTLVKVLPFVKLVPVSELMLQNVLAQKVCSILVF
jgi:hypothetical protein